MDIASSKQHKGDTVTLLQRVMALAKELKQQVTWRYDRTASAPSHKLDTIGRYKEL